MDVSVILALLVDKFPIAGLVLGGLGALVVLGAAVVALTPSKSDDAAYEKVMGIPILGPILKAIAAFSPIAKK